MTRLNLITSREYWETIVSVNLFQKGGRTEKQCDEIATVVVNDMFIDTIRELVNGGWISVEKSLPEFGDAVLICFKSGFVTVGYRMQKGDPYTWNCFGDIEKYTLDSEVTHYRPLPQAPQH